MERPESIGYWRRNTIQALRMELESTCYPFPDPESKSRYLSTVEQIHVLKGREQDIRNRHERILSR